MIKRIIFIVLLGILAWCVILVIPPAPMVRPNNPPVIINATIDQALLTSSILTGERIKRVPSKAKIYIYYPKSYKPGMAMPVFFAMSPNSGNGCSDIFAYIGFAEELKFIIAAVDLPAAEDVEEGRYYYMLWAIDYFKKQNVLQNQPVWIGGFSGGAKWALQLGAWGGNLFDGIIAGGCNEDFATLGYRQIGDRAAFNIPICLLNGISDQVAGIGDYNYFPMIWTIKQTGFLKVKVMIYDGGHFVPYKEMHEAFVWLKSCYDLKKQNNTANQDQAF